MCVGAHTHVWYISVGWSFMIQKHCIEIALWSFYNIWAFLYFQPPYKWPAAALVRVDKYFWNVLTDQCFHKHVWMTSVLWFLIFLQESGKAEETRRAEEKTFRGCCSAEWKERRRVRWWKNAGDTLLFVGSASNRSAFSACLLWFYGSRDNDSVLGFLRKEAASGRGRKLFCFQSL